MSQAELDQLSQKMYMDDSETPVSSLEGDMSIPGRAKGDDSYNTLDEPIKDTVKRDLKAIGTKFFHVLYPKQNKSLILKDWDWWGPLLICTFLAFILQGSSSNSKENDGGPQFAEVFVIVWIGAMVVTLNSKLLGGKISFFQSVCVLGYCLLPPSMALLVCRLILMLGKQTTFLFVLRFIVTSLGFAWAIFAAMAFLGSSQPPRKKGLATYPICLFYFVISWLIISHTT